MKKVLLISTLAIFAMGMIQGATITVTQPSGGDVTMGSVCQIKWTASSVASNVKILLRKPGGALIGTIANNLPLNPGSYNWTVAAPAVIGESYKIHVRATDGSTEGASAVFTVKAAVAQSCGALKLGSPNGGESWLRGSEQTIRWTSTNLAGKVRLELLRYQGAMLGIIAENLPASGSYQWKKAGEYPGNTAPFGKYLVRVRSMAKFECFDEGDAPFNLTLLAMPLKQMVAYPVIEKVFRVPLGALTPGTQLLLNGKHFGTQPGEILMYGNFPNSYNPGPVQLTKVTWKNSTQINGFIPIFSDKGQLDQTVEIRVRNKNGQLSKPWKMQFVGRKEEKFLQYTDVVVLQCGDDGNTNRCNKEGGYLRGSVISDSAIFGFHQNAWAAVGDDVGDDIYQVSLKNGWVFKSMQKEIWTKSSGDEILTGPNPPLPEGESKWTTTIHWKVSPFDHVRYLIKIIVEGPLGTHYK